MYQIVEFDNRARIAAERKGIEILAEERVWGTFATREEAVEMAKRLRGSAAAGVNYRVTPCNDVPVVPQEALTHLLTWIVDAQEVTFFPRDARPALDWLIELQQKNALDCFSTVVRQHMQQQAKKDEVKKA